MASRTRRKPQVTYKSPTVEDRVFITLSCSKNKRTAVASKSATKSSRLSHSQQECHPRNVVSRKYPMSSPLPLFHPLGRLAMSLPPLDPTRYGLPMPVTPDEIEDKPSARSRRPAAKLRELDDEVVATSPTVSSIAAVAAREVKERVSPRKRRTGGAKRKRKDTDDGDATYPAKRTRIPRGVTGHAEEDPPMDIEQSNDVAPVSDMLSDLAETAKRRSTRSKGSLKRRDSSTSETISISGFANAMTSHPGADGITPNITNGETERAEKIDGADNPTGNDDKEEKEEGELSEEHPNP